MQNHEGGVEGKGEGKGGAEGCKMGRVEGRAAWWRTIDVCSTFDVINESILLFHTNMAYLQVGNPDGKILVYSNYRYQKNQERVHYTLAMLPEDLQSPSAVQQIR